MHQLHFRYASEEPRFQSIKRLCQLLDDMPANLRHELLRNLFIHFEIHSGEQGENEKAANYTDLKSKLHALCASLPDDQPVVYGLVCFILGNVHARFTLRLPRLIDSKRHLIKQGSDGERRSLESLREEQEMLRAAYSSFCDLVVGPLLGDEEPMDFGNEWAFDESEPVPVEDIKAALAKLTPGPANTDKSDPIITSFLDQLAAHFDVAVRSRSHTLALRVADKAVSVSVHEYCAPCERHPTRPRVMRLNITGTSPSDKAFRQLGLPLNPKYHLNCRLEFSVLPAELPLLCGWTGEWVRGQALQNPNGPTIPIALDGGEGSFSADNSDWLSVDYLWSEAAREAYKAWENRNEGD